MKNKIKKLLTYAACVFAIMGLSSSIVYAANPLAQTATVYTDIGSAVVKCWGQYYSTGPTRWSRSWTSTSKSNNVMSVVIGSTMTIPSNTKMRTTGTITMTGYSYATDSTTKTFKYKYQNGNVYVDQ